MASFFANFPVINYKFGNEENSTIFQNIGAYIKVIDEIADDIAFYSTLFIQDYDRPDSLSYMLYGTTEFYWTFYYLNEDIRESGWPIPQQDILPKAKIDYPHQTIVTTADISKTFLPGQTATGLGTGNASGIIIKRYLDLGQIVIQTSDTFITSDPPNFVVPVINGVAQTADIIEYTSSVVQYNSVHHYENSSGEHVDLGLVPTGQGDTAFPSTAGKTPITYHDRLIAKNDSLREIKVLKPEVAAQIKTEFNKLLLQG